MELIRKTVGYIRSVKQSDCDSSYQINLISRFAFVRGLGKPEMVVDRRTWSHRNQKDAERAVKLGIELNGGTRFFRGWEAMLAEAQSGLIGTIIVDRRERLYRNLKDKVLLNRILCENDIRILETEEVEWPEDSQAVNVAAYGYFVPNTRKRGLRTANLIGDIGGFYEEVVTHDDWRLVGLYIDSWAYRRNEFPKLLQRVDVKVIICKYFYHMNRKTQAFLQLVEKLTKRDVSLISTEEGRIHFAPVDEMKMETILEPTKVALYCGCSSEYGARVRLITRKKLLIFSRTLSVEPPDTDYYEEPTHAGSKSSEFEKLVRNAEQYNMVIIDSFSVFGETVNELMSCLGKVKIPVCSLKEGLLYIDGKGKTLQSNTIQPCIDNA